jgi:hypothetical protein
MHHISNKLNISHHAFTLKGHGNEEDFLRFLQKLVPHRSLTLAFELFRFWLRIRGDILNQKTTRPLGESAFECLKENSESRQLPGSPSRGVAMKSLFKFFLKFSSNLQHFKRLKQHFKGPT